MSKDVESFNPTFSEVYELKNIHIVNISGGFSHAFAVSNDGKVYGIGINYFGKLGLSKDIEKVEDFVQIQSLSKYKILLIVNHSNFANLFKKINEVAFCEAQPLKKLLHLSLFSFLQLFEL